VRFIASGAWENASTKLIKKCDMKLHCFGKTSVAHELIGGHVKSIEIRKHAQLVNLKPSTIVIDIK